MPLHLDLTPYHTHPPQPNFIPNPKIHLSLNFLSLPSPPNPYLSNLVPSQSLLGSNVDLTVAPISLCSLLHTGRRWRHHRAHSDIGNTVLHLALYSFAMKRWFYLSLRVCYCWMIHLLKPLVIMPFQDLKLAELMVVAFLLGRLFKPNWGFYGPVTNRWSSSWNDATLVSRSLISYL